MGNQPWNSSLYHFSISLLYVKLSTSSTMQSHDKLYSFMPIQSGSYEYSYTSCMSQTLFLEHNYMYRNPIPRMHRKSFV
jgi:hypothetical protein